MKSIWKGNISFGLVNIPIALGTAVREEGLKFRMLRKSDMSPIRFKRVAESDGKEVPWDLIAKGYEYEKDRFILMEDADFESAGTAPEKTIRIEQFVDLAEINPLHFDKPYYIEPQKGADHAYVLLREALKVTGKIGIARVVISGKEHLAALKPQGDLLVLELMHYASEIVDASDLRPPGTVPPAKKELDMAKSLIANMTEKWQPEALVDEYTGRLEKVIADKVKAGGKSIKTMTPAKSAQVINLMDALAASLKSAGKKTKKSASKGAA